jgi:hypothetical protein
VTRSDFIELPEWQTLVRSMRKQMETCIENALASDSLGEVKYNAGFRDALLSVIALPQSVLSDGEPPRKPEPEGVIELINHPRPVRSAF